MNSEGFPIEVDSALETLSRRDWSGEPGVMEAGCRELWRWARKSPSRREAIAQRLLQISPSVLSITLDGLTPKSVLIQSMCVSHLIELLSGSFQPALLKFLPRLAFLDALTSSVAFCKDEEKQIGIRRSFNAVSGTIVSAAGDNLSLHLPPSPSLVELLVLFPSRYEMPK